MKIVDAHALDEIVTIGLCYHIWVRKSKRIMLSIGLFSFSLVGTDFLICDLPRRSSAQFDPDLDCGRKQGKTED